MSKAGFCFTTDDFPGSPPAVSGGMDVGGLALALRSDTALIRVFYKGKPTLGWLAAKILEIDKLRARLSPNCTIYYQVGNEPNLPQEGWEGGLPAYRSFFASLRALLPTNIKLAWAGMSPGVEGWQAWYEGIESADAVVAHAYGQTLGELQTVVNAIMARTRLPIIVGECNFGPGKDIEVNRDDWAIHVWSEFLDWADTITQILFVLYFAYTWNSDMELKTPVDAKDTKIVPVTMAWASRPAKKAPVGRGWWVWYISECGGVPGIIAACKKTNAHNVYIKGGDGPYVWDQVTPAVVSALNAEGINVYLWHYAYFGWLPGTVHGDTWKWTTKDEVATVSQMLTQAGPNIAGFVVDAEAETEGRANEATDYGNGVQARLGSKWFAYAPLPVIDYHTGLPFVQLNAVCDAVLPQFYSKNLDGNPPWTYARLIEQWTRWMAAWKSAGQRVPTLMPIGETYGDADAASVQEFETLAKQQEWPSWSYWSLQHALANGLIDAIPTGDPADTPAPDPATPEEVVIQLTPEDKTQAEAIFNDIWAQAAALGVLLDKPAYGDAGARTAYWGQEAFKSSIDLVKEILGMNDNA